MKRSRINIFYRLLQLLAFIFLGVSFYLSYFYFPHESYWHVFFLHITTELVVVLFVTFIFEKALEHSRATSEEKRWFTAKSFAKHDMEHLARSLAATVLIYSDTKFSTKEASQPSKEGDLYLIEKLENITDAHLKSFFSALSKDGEEVKRAIRRDKFDLESTISLYKDVLPPQFLHPLWATRSSMNKFNTVFMECFALFKDHNENKPSSSEEGLYEKAFETCEESLRAYINNLAALLKAIGENSK